jgi:putative ABC transport system substrate-binding protein
MSICLRRREFIAALGGAAAWPLAARAQQPAMPVIGLLSYAGPEATARSMAPFRAGLSETGFVEGRNVVIEYRLARNEADRLPELAADLVRRRVAVIVAPNGLTPGLAAKAATTTIPIVFGTGGDPVQNGLVASLNRPGGNVTGVTGLQSEVVPKVIGLMNELLPTATRFAVLIKPNDRNGEPATRAARAAAATIGRQIEILGARDNGEIDTAFASLVQSRVDALVVGPFTLFGDRRVQILTLAAHHRVPAIYYSREFAEVGGLMSYGPNSADASRQIGIYVGRILKGEKPADLPVMQASKFEFIINLQTAKTLGLTIPPTLLAIADELIE